MPSYDNEKSPPTNILDINIVDDRLFICKKSYGNIFIQKDTKATAIPDFTSYSISDSSISFGNINIYEFRHFQLVFKDRNNKTTEINFQDYSQFYTWIMGMFCIIIIIILIILLIWRFNINMKDDKKRLKRSTFNNQPHFDYTSGNQTPNIILNLLMEDRLSSNNKNLNKKGLNILQHRSEIIDSKNQEIQSAYD